MLRLELRSSDASGARYGLELATAGGEWRTLVDLEVSGNLSFSEWSAAEPPAYLCAAASAILRTLLRDQKTGQSKVWPRRIQRWRSEPDPKKER